MAESKRGVMTFLLGFCPRSFFDRRLPIPEEKRRAKIMSAVE
jgi:hypothetical protein